MTKRHILSLLFIFFGLIGLIAQEQWFDFLTYRNIGPFRGGRSAAVTGVDHNPDLYYVGYTGGGVFKTENGGKSWQNISDGYFGGSIGAIAVSKSDPNVIYVGGGEVTVRGNVSSGSGIYKSVDAGKTWTDIGLKKSRHIARIRIHPTNPDIVYAAVLGDLYKSSTERGVYKSIDGGKTWRKVLFANADAGAVDLIIDPNNYRVLYASTWRVRRTPYSLSSGGEGSDLYKSMDGGETWKKISGAKGLPSSGALGIIGVAVSPQNSDRVYAIIENQNGGVFRSDDGGENWMKVNSSRALRQRAWYYSRIYCDPKDQNTVYVMNVSYHKSTDGGKTFKSNYAPHGDHHDLWIASDDPERMIIADDGGAQISYNGGKEWSTYHNQPTAQFYRVTTDNAFPFRVYAAQQDNSTIRIKHRSFSGSIGDDDYENTAGGESAHIAVDPLNNDIVYGGSYGGFLTRVDHKTNKVRAINVWPDNPMGAGAEAMKYRFQWNFPIFFSPHNPKKLYTASNHLHVSTDEGHSWEIISPDLTRNDPEKLKSSGGPITQDNTGVEYYCTIFAAAESPLQEGLLWVGSDDGLVHVSTDGGKNWKNVTPKGLPNWIMINSLEPSPHDANTAYIAATMYKSGDYKPYLYVTHDKGASWKKITYGIGVEDFTRVVREDPVRKDMLFAGTESGMYISFNGGNNWEKFQLNLPTVPITDLTIKGEHLIVATQGRALWMMDDLQILRDEKKENFNKTALLKPKANYRMPGYQVKKPVNSGKNHYSGARTYFNLTEADAKKEVKLKYLDSKGEVIKTFSTKDKDNKLSVKKGINHHDWNMVYPGAKRFDGMIFWWGSTGGAVATPGQYKVRMVVDQDSLEQPFEILKDPRSDITPAQYKAQFDFIDGVNKKVTEAHEAIIDMRNVRKQIKSINAFYKDNEDAKGLIDMGNEIDSLMSVVEKKLYQTKNRSGQDPLNFPIKLTNKLAHLNSLTRMGDYPPTAGAVAVKDELVGKIDKELAEWARIKSTLVSKYNTLFREQKLDILQIKN